MIINDKKLPPLTKFKNQSQLPDVNTSINEGGPETHEKPKEDTQRKQKKPKEASVPTTSLTVRVSSAKHSEIVNEVLTTPVVKKKKTLGVHLSKIPRCITSKEFQNLMREKEEAKCQKQEEKEDRKRMRQAKAEEKCQQQAKQENRELTKVEKAKVAAIKALAAQRLKSIK